MTITRKTQPALRLVTSDGLVVSGYKSGRKRLLEIPLTDSMASTRSAGTVPRASQLETVLCAPKSSRRAKALCPPTALQASNNASLLMFPINAQTDNRVNAVTGNRRVENGRMGRKAEKPASAFWKRLEEALGNNPRYMPLNANSLATKLDKSQGTTYRWFDGTGLPELQQALDLAKDGGVCVDWLLNNVKPKYPISKDPILRELFELCEDLESAGRERVLRAAKGELLQQHEERTHEQQNRRATASR